MGFGAGVAAAGGVIGLCAIVRGGGAIVDGGGVIEFGVAIFGVAASAVGVGAFGIANFGGAISADCVGEFEIVNVGGGTSAAGVAVFVNVGGATSVEGLGEVENVASVAGVGEFGIVVLGGAASVVCPNISICSPRATGGGALIGFTVMIGRGGPVFEIFVSSSSRTVSWIMAPQVRQMDKVGARSRLQTGHIICVDGGSD